MKIRAALIEKPGEDFRIETLELAEPRRDEALVKIAACGVCHTDDVARNQIIPVPLPAVFGHEGCGVIEALGPGMEDFRPGDRVLFSFGYCGKCPNCRSGHPYACLHNRRLNFSGEHFDGSRRLSRNGRSVSAFFGQGSFATHAVVHRNNLIPAPDDLPLELLAPLGCGIQTGAGAVLNYLRAEAGSSIDLPLDSFNGVQRVGHFIDGSEGRTARLAHKCHCKDGKQYQETLLHHDVNGGD